MAGTGLEYKGVASISGPIIVVENVQQVGYDELVAVKTQTGEIRLGKVIEVNQKAVTVRVGVNPSRHQILRVWQGIVVFLEAHQPPFAAQPSKSIHNPLEIFARKAASPLDFGGRKATSRLLGKKGEDLLLRCLRRRR